MQKVLSISIIVFIILLFTEASAQTLNNADEVTDEPVTYGEERKKAKAYFLRNTTVLTSRGEFNFGVRFSYQHSRTDYTLPGSGTFSRSNYTLDSMRLVADLSYGILNNLEVFIDPSLTYNIALDSIFTSTETTHKVGLSDIIAGLRYLVLDESFSIPSISINFSLQIPVGSNQYGPDGPAALSGGHWATTLGVGVVKSLDPSILFGGLDVGYQYKLKQNGVTYAPGLNIMAYAGIGLAITDSLTFSQTLYFGYNQEIYVNNERQHGSSSMPFILKSGISYQTWGNKTWTFDFQYGINDDAPVLGITLGFYL